MNAPDVRVAEQLWIRAHEFVRRGEFANAVRDLASAYQILQALSDPRLPEVHRRWIEVHQMYLEDGARNDKREPEEKASNLQAEAEAAANQGDLHKAIALYEKVVAASSDDELARERLDELRQAKRRADELSGPARATAPAHTAPMQTAAPAAQAAAPTITTSGVAEDDWTDVAAVSEEGAPVVEEAPAASAPVVGISATDDRWGAPAASQQVAVAVAAAAKAVPSSTGGADVGAQVAQLEAMLARISERRRGA